jgi:hypothetical protein
MASWEIIGVSRNLPLIQYEKVSGDSQHDIEVNFPERKNHTGIFDRL